MFKSKAKVDQQANLILSKVQDDNEKRLRGYQLGNLYYQAREYEQAKKYVSLFLAVKEQYAPAHKLMAQILERSSAQEDIKKSISYYKRSFELDDTQRQLTLKICALLLRIDIAPELAPAAMYWIEKAKSYFPSDPIVFSLQEKMIQQALTLNTGQDQNTSISDSAMEDLLVSNLKSRPYDVSVRVKLLKCLERSQQFDVALAYIREVLMKSPYYDNFDWYNYTAELLKFVTKDGSELSWSIYLLHNFGAARTAIRNGPEKIAADALQRLDQALYNSQHQTGSLISAMREELCAQQLLLAANLLVRRNADPPAISALYVAAYNQPADAAGITRSRGDDLRELTDTIEQLRAHRLTQSGYLVLDRAPPSDQLNWLRKLSRKFFSKDGKKTLHSAIFGAADIDGSRNTSMFMADTSLEQLQAALPDRAELTRSCALAQLLYPDSLHHQTWLAHRLPGDSVHNCLMEFAPRLNFSPPRLGQCEPDSLSQMDLTIFLLHSTYSAKSRLQEHRSGDNSLKVSDLSPSLCSDEQSQWWSTVYDCSVQNTVSASVLRFGRQRQLISRGLQAVRLIDNHGLSVQMVCNVAQLLQAKLDEAKVQFSATSSKVIHLTYWVKQYWTEAVRMLTVLHSNGTLSRLGEKLFMSYDDEPSSEALQELLATGRLWLALQLYEDDREDEALQELKELPQPIASYTSAQIYQSKADGYSDADDAKETYLLRTQECLHLTMDRLAGDITNPLNADVERALERIENELDGHSLSYVSATESASNTANGSMLATPIRPDGARSNMRLTSTARGTPGLSIADLSSNTPRVRPSPERLELQVRSLATAHESLRTTIHEERNLAAESNKQMIDCVSEIFDRRLAELVHDYKRLAEDMSWARSSLQDMKVSQQQVQANIAGVKGDVAAIKTDTAVVKGEQFSTKTDMAGIKADIVAMKADIFGIKTRLSTPVPPPPTVQPSSSDTQVSFLQQQLAALTAMMATSLQHPVIRPVAASLSGYGTPSRATPPVYQPGLADAMQLGTYPHIQQPQSTTPSRAQTTAAGKAALTQQEMHAAALAAAEQGYDDREYYVDDGENYYEDEYTGNDYYGDVNTGGYVGAEGCNTIAYMPKTSASGKPMPQPGFFAQPDKSQTKLADPKPAEQGVPPNVVMDKERMDKEAAKQKPAELNQGPLVVNVPKPSSIPIVPTTPTSVSQGKVVPPSPAKSDTGSVHDSSFDPHFEPIMELPPEINVVTGEEEEEVLFECRAKVFRQVDKEWKERGVGPVKILERKDQPGKCRLLMRRDQVHKICLNHSVHQAKTLVPMGDKGNAWIWSATDHSESEPTHEYFAIRFKTPEIAADFKKFVAMAIEKSLKVETKDDPRKEVDEKPATADKVSAADGAAKSSLSEMFKPKTDQWRCDGCSLVHNVTAVQCPACNTPQPGVSPSQATSSTTTTSTGTPSVGFGTFKISNTTSLFGDSASANKPPLTFGAGLFSQTAEVTPTPAAGPFGTTATTSTPVTKSLFGSTTTQPTSTPSLFGSKAVDTGSSQPTGLFSGFSNPAAAEGNKSEEGSLLRQLLSAESTTTKPAAKPAEPFSMGGFTFNAPPKTDVKESQSTEKPATSKAPLLAGFAGFTTPVSSSTGGFTFSTPATSSSTKASPFSFTSTTSVVGQALAPSKSDMKQSSSAPLLGQVSKSAVDNSSKDDSALLTSPTKNPEEECNAEFAPVIELPDLVEVTTGEEDEEAMFGERCKLYRMSEGQWKERGLGELKILKHKTTEACRLVMRREQVFKLCANHQLISGMKLAPNGPKAWIWAAQDFSDNELKSETLCARFKTAEIAEQFEKAFNDAVNSQPGASTQSLTDTKSDNKPTSTSKSDKTSQQVTETKGEDVAKTVDKPAAASKGGAASLAELFKPKGGEWSCAGCAVRNTASVKSCPCCGTNQPGTESDTAPQQESAAPPASAGFSSFTFSPFPAAAKSADAAKPATTAAGGFTGFTGFNFSKPAGTEPSSSPVKSSVPVPESPGKYVEVEGEGDHIHFEPVIELPDLVDVKTGEEDETELYMHRAKLYRFTNGEFKERGLGDVKILKHKMTDKVRIILRREKVLKLACNHIITVDMNLRAMENAAGKAWIWYAMDFAEGAGSQELFAIRFKTAEIAEEFKACFDAAKKNEQVPEQKLKTVTPQKSRSRAASESNSANRSRPPSESHSGTPVKPSTSKSQADTTTTTTPASGTSLFGNLTACSPANPRSQSAATNLFGTQSTPAAGFGSTSAPMQATSDNKPLNYTVAKSDESQESDSTTVVSTSAADLGKSKIPVPATNSTPVTTAASEEQTTTSTPSKSMIPLVNGKSTPGSSAQPLLAQPKLDTSKTGSIFGGKALFGQSGSTSASPSANNNGSTSIFGAKPTSQSLFGGAGAKSSPQSVFGGATSSPQAVFGGAKASPQSLFGGGGATNSPQSVFGGTPTNRSVFGGSGAGSTANGDSDVEFVCENRPSEELVRKAKEFLLPSGYYMYEERRGCRGCIGCESNEDAILDHLFHNKSYTKQPGLSLACKSTKTPSSKAVVGKSDGDDGLFTDFKTTIDFSSAGAANNPNAFQKTEGFKWSGAGSTLFGGDSGASKQDEENPEAYEAKADFKPVLDVLPEMIEVKTGEEDEERIFCNRGKLYRFDVSTNQWKERGVGEMKLLKHHEKGTVRVLLRREQVHKLVCNHLVQPDLELRPMATSETAWCWFAKDYSDNSSEDPAVEQFAVRFKNIELAKEFKQRFEESKVFVREALETRANQAAAAAASSQHHQPPERIVSQAEDGDYGEEDSDDDESDDSDEDIKLLYERQVTLLQKQGGQYQPIGVRTLQVVEENIDIIGGIAIYILHGEENLEYRQLIFRETPTATVDKKVCSWHMYDFLSERPHIKYFQAQFASHPAAEEFSKHITEGIAYAKAMQLSEAEAIHTSMSTNPTELDLSQAHTSPK